VRRRRNRRELLVCKERKSLNILQSERRVSACDVFLSDIHQPYFPALGADVFHGLRRASSEGLGGYESTASRRHVPDPGRGESRRAQRRQPACLGAEELARPAKPLSISAM